MIEVCRVPYARSTESLRGCAINSSSLLAAGELSPRKLMRLAPWGATDSVRLTVPLLDRWPAGHAGAAHTWAPPQSMATTGSSPTTQASCPGGR